MDISALPRHGQALAVGRIEITSCALTSIRRRRYIPSGVTAAVRKKELPAARDRRLNFVFTNRRRLGQNGGPETRIVVFYNIGGTAMPESDNAELLSRRTTIEAALREVQDDLFRFLARRLGDKNDAADVLQEFYVRVLKSFDGVKDENKLRPWMDQVLRSAIADHYRRRSRDNRLKEGHRTETLIDGPISDEDLDLIVCTCLYKLLPTIHEDYASLLWRVDLLGEPRDEVRVSLGLTESAFRVKLHRARHALRERLEQSCDACAEHRFLNCGCERAESLRRRLDQEGLRSCEDAERTRRISD